MPVKQASSLQETSLNSENFGSLIYNYTTQKNLKVLVDLSAPLHGDNNHIFADIRIS